MLKEAELVDSEHLFILPFLHFAYNSEQQTLPIKIHLSLFPIWWWNKFWGEDRGRRMSYLLSWVIYLASFCPSKLLYKLLSVFLPVFTETPEYWSLAGRRWIGECLSGLASLPDIFYFHLVTQSQETKWESTFWKDEVKQMLQPGSHSLCRVLEPCLISCVSSQGGNISQHRGHLVQTSQVYFLRGGAKLALD